jgi:hypothetical protein
MTEKNAEDIVGTFSVSSEENQARCDALGLRRIITQYRR